MREKEIEMGEAKRRGTFEERKAQAIAAGRKRKKTVKSIRVRRSNQNPAMALGFLDSIFEGVIGYRLFPRKVKGQENG